MEIKNTGYYNAFSSTKSCLFLQFIAIERIVDEGYGIECWLPLFSSFPTMFSKGLVLMVV